MLGLGVFESLCDGSYVICGRDSVRGTAAGNLIRRSQTHREPGDYINKLFACSNAALRLVNAVRYIIIHQPRCDHPLDVTGRARSEDDTGFAQFRVVGIL